MKLRVLRLVLHVALAMLASQVMAAELSIALRAEVLVAGAEYTVADIAAIDTSDRDLMAHVGALRVGIVRPGSVEHVWRNQVTRVIEASHPELRGRLAWSGPERVELRRAGVQADRGEIEKIARAFLADLLQRDHERVELKAIPSSDSVLLPAGATELRPRLAGGLHSSRRMCVWIDVLMNGALHRSVPVWFEVSAQRVVLVASSALPAGTVISNEHFTSELREVQGLSGIPARLPLERNAVRLKRPLQAGQMLVADHLEAVPAVARNQDVTVRVQAGGINLEAAGIALADGKLGTIVRVRNPASKETFPAQVIDHGVVAVTVR